MSYLRCCVRSVTSLMYFSSSRQKKMKFSCSKEPSFASVGKHGVLREFTFFDKVRITERHAFPDIVYPRLCFSLRFYFFLCFQVRRLFKSQEVYENFLRCIALFNQEVVSGAELLQLVTPFLG